VLGDRRSRHVEPGRQFCHGTPTPAKAIEDRSAGGVGYGMEDVDAGTGS
jgi:hypothetical protein